PGRGLRPTSAPCRHRTAAATGWSLHCAFPSLMSVERFHSASPVPRSHQMQFAPGSGHRENYPCCAPPDERERADRLPPRYECEEKLQRLRDPRETARASMAVICASDFLNEAASWAVTLNTT